MIQKITDNNKKKEITRKVLEALPEWFEVEQSREQYIADSVKFEYFAAFVDDRPVGFMCLKQTGKKTVELAVTGVLKQYHRMGLGRQMFELAKKTAIEQGYSFMQVKTVKMGVYDSYDKTNRFYLSLGFKELEVIECIWGKENPCQIYVMALQ